MSDSFGVTKLPKEMPKMPKMSKLPKVEVRLRRSDFKVWITKIRKYTARV
jgi:hypothetical protein